MLDRFSKASTGSGSSEHAVLLQGRRQLLRLLVELAKHSNQLPTSLFVAGVTLLSNEPCAMGGFADVFRGKLGDMTVALKRLRVVADQTHQIAMINHVRRLFYRAVRISSCHEPKLAGNLPGGSDVDAAKTSFYPRLSGDESRDLF